MKSLKLGKLQRNEENIRDIGLKKNINRYPSAHSHTFIQKHILSVKKKTATLIHVPSLTKLFSLRASRYISRHKKYTGYHCEKKKKKMQPNQTEN